MAKAQFAVLFGERFIKACRATIRMRMRDNQDENPVWGERRRA